MSYSTPHHVRDYLAGACLAITHEYCLRCTGRANDYRKKVLEDTKEIDLCARLGAYFGTSARLAAQGSDKADLISDSPPFQVEVKFLLPKRTNWGEVSADWDDLRNLDNNGGIFRRRALVWFWPSSQLFRFTQCLSVTRDLTDDYSEASLAPFWPYTNVVMPPSGRRQRIEFAEPHHQGPHAVQLPNGRRFRLDIVGATTHPVWAVIVTRLTPTEHRKIVQADSWTLRDTAFDISEWT